MGNFLEWTKKHPVSNVVWVESSMVSANDYNQFLNQSEL